MAWSTDRVTLRATMKRPAMGRWCVQLRLQLKLNGEAEIPEVWATLGAQSRGKVVERLAKAMVNAVAPSGQGGEGHGEDNQGCGTSHEGGGKNVPRIA